MGDPLAAQSVDLDLAGPGQPTTLSAYSPASKPFDPEKLKVNISISYVCPNTGDKHTRIVGLGAFSASGGCTGHFHPDEFCYCAKNSSDVIW